MAEITLYHGWTSSASRKVRFCLAEKGLDYESVPIEILTFEHHSAWFKKLNPSGKVPALVIDGEPFVESNLINEYLDERWPTPKLMPADPKLRYEVQLFAQYIDETCLPAIQKHNWMRRMHPIAREWSDEELAERLSAIPTENRRHVWYRMARNPYTDEELQTALDILIDMTDRIGRGVERHGWIVGDAFGLADIAAAPYVRRLVEIAPEEVFEKRPAVAGWWERLTARPAYAAAQMHDYDEQSEPGWQPSLPTSVGRPTSAARARTSARRS